MTLGRSLGATLALAFGATTFAAFALVGEEVGRGVQGVAAGLQQSAHPALEVAGDELRAVLELRQALVDDGGHAGAEPFGLGDDV